jgi:hypothetical protein
MSLAAVFSVPLFGKPLENGAAVFQGRCSGLNPTRGVMAQVTIKLSDEMYAELESAAADVHELGFTPERWAEEAVESALASRRLPRVKLGKNGACIKRRNTEDLDNADAN